MAKPEKSKPKVNPKLEGYEIQIDSLGEIQSTFAIDKINRFLDEEVIDKKLVERDDYKKTRKGNSGKKARRGS